MSGTPIQCAPAAGRLCYGCFGPDGDCAELGWHAVSGDLADIFRGIATQEMPLFDIETSEQFQPLDLPRLLDAIENDLRLQRITEPERLLAKLQEVAGNPTQPLIARNHATRMVNDIKRGKFKTMM